MPIDWESHLSNWLNYTATSSSLGTLLVNPIWMALIIVAVILLINHLSGTLPRTALYSSIATVALVLAHDGVFSEQMREKQPLGGGIAELSESHSIEPRSGHDRSYDFNPVNADELMAAI